MNLIMFANGTSENHGCEAINCSTLKILRGAYEKIYCSTTHLSYEKDLPDGAEWVEYSYFRKPTIINRAISKAQRTILHSNSYAEKKPWLENVIHAYDSCDIALSVGGDNYCNGSYEWLYALHEQAKRKGLKTVLWGCSVDKECLENSRMLSDLKQYDLILARESLTYKILSSFHNNVRLYPDPAFVLDKVELPWPDNFDYTHGVVGINISPTSIACESVCGITESNYSELIDYIIGKTDYSVALIPHVIFARNTGDMEVMIPLYKKYKNTGRVTLIGDHNCEELKGYIARCRLFVTARTHASIAAYSSGVPTLVLGYSIKARGIATDLFGTEKNYVLPVQSLKTTQDLCKAFNWLQEHESTVRTQLQEKMKTYIPNVYHMRSELEKV